MGGEDGGGQRRWYRWWSLFSKIVTVDDPSSLCHNNVHNNIDTQLSFGCMIDSQHQKIDVFVQSITLSYNNTIENEMKNESTHTHTHTHTNTSTSKYRINQSTKLDIENTDHFTQNRRREISSFYQTNSNKQNIRRNFVLPGWLLTCSSSSTPSTPEIPISTISTSHNIITGPTNQANRCCCCFFGEMVVLVVPPVLLVVVVVLLLPVFLV